MAVRCIYFCISIYKCVTFIALLWMFATSILHFQVCYIWMLHLFYISTQVCYIWMVVRCIYFCSEQLHLQAVAFPPAAACGEPLLRRMRLPSITSPLCFFAVCSLHCSLCSVHCTVFSEQWVLVTNEYNVLHFVTKDAAPNLGPKHRIFTLLLLQYIMQSWVYKSWVLSVKLYIVQWAVSLSTMYYILMQCTVHVQ